MILSGVSKTMAQAPFSINYQAVARDSNTGMELANQPVFVSLKILEESSNGSIIYQEDHSGLQTNLFGMFTLSIGQGEPVTGNFVDINWGASSYWLEIDIDAGNGLETLGTMQFLSVPYALHAQTVTNVDDADADPENELVQDFQFDGSSGNLSIVQQGFTLTQNLNALINDADADPENELVTDIDFNSSTNTFSLTQPGSTLTQDLSALINDADADPENELVTDIDFNSSTNTFSLIQTGSTLTQDLSALINDADADPENELVTDIDFNSSTNTFSLIQPGSTLTQDLSALINDADADPENELVTDLDFNSSTNTFSLIQTGSTLTQDLSALINDADADPENELVTDIDFNSSTNTFSLTQPGSTLTQDLSDLINDADADPENELVSSINFNSSTNVFSLVQPGSTLTQDLTDLIDDADADPDNELITSVVLSEGILTVEEAGTNHSVNLTQLINDADFDPENELITSLELFEDTIIRISEGSVINNLDVSSLKRDVTWTQSADNITIYNNSLKVGINTPTPITTFEVNGSIAYKTTILQNSTSDITYNTSSIDNIIICIIESGFTMADITINMPPAVSFPGRTITIRKTGLTPVGPDVNIFFGNNQLDFSSSTFQLNGFVTETAKFISMGANGWTKIYSD